MNVEDVNCAEEENCAEEGGEEGSEGRERVRILLVEDDETHAFIIRRILERSKLNTEIFEVRDGESAMDFLLNRGDYADKSLYPRPDIVLLDLRLPGIDGTEVLRRIKEEDELRDLSVVILTSSESDEDIIRTYEDGASGYILKSAFVLKSPRMNGLLDIILSLVR
ncbi:response regulator [Methanosarcinales archaeon]|nr:MAG: response regulator [Methanosarcinales archaeon]